MIFRVVGGLGVRLGVRSERAWRGVGRGRVEVTPIRLRPRGGQGTRYSLSTPPWRSEGEIVRSACIGLMIEAIFQNKSVAPGRISFTLMKVAYIRVRHEVHRGLSILVHQPRALVSVLITIGPDICDIWTKILRELTLST